MSKKISLTYFLLIITQLILSPIGFANQLLVTHKPKHFSKVMIVIFENMSYAEIKNEPTFKKLITYTGHMLDQHGRLVKLLESTPKRDTLNNGYAFFSSYFNNHNGGTIPVRPSQPNYIALTSGSTHGVRDNGIYNLDADNLGIELNDANIKWKVYAEDLPDPKASMLGDNSMSHDSTSPALQVPIKPFIRDPNKNEADNDTDEQQYIEDFKKLHHINEITAYDAKSGCFIGESNVDSSVNTDDGYKRKHEPFISYLNIQRDYSNCKNIMNASHLYEDINNMPDVAIYIPNQRNDGHNGNQAQRTERANTFLSKMIGTNPKTGETLPGAENAPFQKIMAQDGLLIITFDETSVTGNPDNTIYTLLAGKMINSGAYPMKNGKHLPICYPAKAQQNRDRNDANGLYQPLQCNHYNLLKLIENNWELRGLNPKDTSAGYKYAYALDNSLPELWKSQF